MFVIGLRYIIVGTMKSISNIWIVERVCNWSTLYKSWNLINSILTFLRCLALDKY